MSYGNGYPKPSAAVAINETTHFELVHIPHNEINYFYICAKPHYDKAVKCGPNTWSQAMELMHKLERLWPCHFLCKEWPK